jgi:hypothetical protein
MSTFGLRTSVNTQMRGAPVHARGSMSSEYPTSNAQDTAMRSANWTSPNLAGAFLRLMRNNGCVAGVEITPASKFVSVGALSNFSALHFEERLVGLSPNRLAWSALRCRSRRLQNEAQATDLQKGRRRQGVRNKQRSPRTRSG